MTKISNEQLKRILHEEKMEKQWIEIRAKQKTIREKQDKRKQYLIDNDMEYLESNSRYWPPISDTVRRRQENKIKKHNEQFSGLPDELTVLVDDRGIPLPPQYPSGYEFMYVYKPYADAVVVHSVKVILCLMAFAYIWSAT